MSCVHYWDSPFQVSTHHLARQFIAAGWRVAYISSPLTPFHLFLGSRHDVSERFKLYRRGPTRLANCSLTPWVPGAAVAPDNRLFLRSHLITRYWPKLTVPNLGKVLASIEFQSPDVLYLDSFYHAGLLDCVAADVIVYHMADNYSGFSGYGDGFHSSEAELCKRADAVAVPSESLRGVAEAFGPREVLFLPNGVDSHCFAPGQVARPAAYDGLSKPIAVYVGAMDAWFDFSLIEFSARRLPEVEFVLIGPQDAVPRSLRELGNIRLTGMIGHDQLPGYLVYADVGLIPFNVSRFESLLNPVRPLKLLEYLAAGLPVVSMRWNELDLMRAPIILAESKEEFVQGIISAIGQRRIETQARIEYANENDWAVSFGRFESWLNARFQRK